MAGSKAEKGERKKSPHNSFRFRSHANGFRAIGGPIFILKAVQQMSISNHFDKETISFFCLMMMMRTIDGIKTSPSLLLPVCGRMKQKKGLEEEEEVIRNEQGEEEEEGDEGEEEEEGNEDEN